MNGLAVGRIVHYVLTKEDAEAINRRRTNTASVEKLTMAGAWSVGAQAHIGNPVAAGDHVAAVVVAVWSDSGTSNLKCLLDGNDDFWATSIPFDSTDQQNPRTWHWPEEV